MVKRIIIYHNSEVSRVINPNIIWMYMEIYKLIYKGTMKIKPLQAEGKRLHTYNLRLLDT